MKYLFAGGGTGGHVNPAIAIANALRESDKTAEIAFIGTKKGLENKLVAAAGYPLYHIEMSGLQRRLTFANLKTFYYYLTAPHKAKKLLLSYQPDIVIGTGGYLCWPLLHAAAKLGIPTAVHESNAIPGKAVKMLEKEIDRIYVNFPSTAELLTEKEKIRFVGIPLIDPPQIAVTENSESIKATLGIPNGIKHILLSFGGSLGAKRINEEVLLLMKHCAAKDSSLFHIHAAGKVGYEDVRRRATELGLDKYPNIRIVEYIYDMPTWERVADVVICRAGAMTLSEMALLRKACVIIPSPNVVNNHQYENAKRLADAGAAVLLEEKELVGDTLEKNVRHLMNNKSYRDELSHNIRTFANPNAKEAILQDISLLVSHEVSVPLNRKNKK